MGWLGKSAAFLIAVVLFGVGMWEISLLILAVLLVPAIFRTRRGKGAPRENGRQRGKFPVRFVLGGSLLLLALGAYLIHGSYSPFVLASLGLLVVLWGRLPMSVLGSELKPVDDSILLRSSPFPVSWAAVAEVKPITHDVGRALAGLTGAVVVSASDSPSIYFVVERLALNQRSAEDAVIATLRETAMSLAALGAYLLPLDSKRALSLLQPSLEAFALGGADWPTALASGAYDFLSIKQEKGFARSLSAYKKVGQGREGRGRIPSPSRELVHPPFLMEVYKAVGNRLTWPNPDQYAAFLSSLLATSGEPIGTRVLDAGDGSQSQMVVVKSQGSPSVELSRAQLRAVVRMYDKG